MCHYWPRRVYLECTLRVGDLTATADLRLYLRDKTVRRLNRHRSPEHRVHFRSKFHLARDILEALKPLLPAGWTIYVQFDSWYASEKLLKYVHRQGWHAVCALKSNRTLRSLLQRDRVGRGFRGAPDRPRVPLVARPPVLPSAKHRALVGKPPVAPGAHLSARHRRYSLRIRGNT